MTGLRLDTRQMKRKLGELRRHMRADRFKPDVLEFTRKSLATASRLTPVRPLDVIRNNQIVKEGNQYERWRNQGGQGGITKADFLAARAPARFLYKASWGQCARSINLDIPESADVLSATTRQEQEPPQGYCQMHGGNDVFSVSVRNPFLEIPSRFKPFTGRQILSDAMEKHRSQFLRAVASRFKVIAYAIFAKHG